MKLKKFFDYVLYVAATLFCLGLLGAGFYFYFYQTAIAVLLAIIGIIGWQTYKFAKMILILEDDLSGIIESLKEVEASMDHVLEIKLFFDTPEVQQVVHGVMNTVRMAKFGLNQATKKFIDRSKQKYVTIIEEDEGDITEERPGPAEIMESLSVAPSRFMGQGGITTNVERSKQKN